MFCVRFTPAVCRIAPNRTACAVFRSYSDGSRSPFARSRGVGAVICLGGFTSGLAVSLWRSRRGYRDAGTRERGWRRGLCAFLRSRIGVAALSAGSTLGLRAPDCAKESSTLWTLLRGWPSEKVRFTRRGRCSALYVSELRAGARLRLAGFSAGTGDCARGGCSAR